MATVTLNSGGLSFKSEKKNIELKWIRPLVGFHTPTPTNITLDQIVDEWVGVYENHLKSYFKGIPEDTPGFKFGKVGITDSSTEYSRDHDVTYLVVEGKLIRQQMTRELKSNGGYRGYIFLYLEGPGILLEKFFRLIKSAMRKALISEASKAKSAG